MPENVESHILLGAVASSAYSFKASLQTLPKGGGTRLCMPGSVNASKAFVKLGYMISSCLAKHYDVNVRCAYAIKGDEHRQTTLTVNIYCLGE